MIYTVTFNPALDYVIQLDELQLGSVNRSTWDDIQCGGKGINVSNMLHNLGVKSIALGFTAGFTGQALEKQLEEAGVKTDFVRLHQGLTRINIKLKADAETEINGKGPDVEEKDLEEFFRKFDQVKAGDTIVLAGSIPETFPDDIYERIMAYMTAKFMDNPVYFVVDTCGQPLMNVLKYKPFLIKPNHLELEEIFQKEFSGEEEIIAHGKLLQEMGARNVLVSMAKEGAVLLAENGDVFRQQAAVGEVVNSVGAGDSMVAGFLAGWQKSGDYKTALKVGAAAGGATAFSSGLGRKDMIEALLASME